MLSELGLAWSGVLFSLRHGAGSRARTS